MNTILITADAFRKDLFNRVSGTFSGDIVPHLDSLAKEGRFLRDAYANGCRTSEAFYSIFTGNYPSKADKIIFGEGLETYPLQKGNSLVELLQRDGVNCGGIHSNPRMNAEFGYDFGFDWFEDHDQEDQPNEMPSFLMSLKGFIKKAMERSDTLDSILRSRYRQIRIIEETFSGLPYTRGADVVDRAKNWIERNSEEEFFLWIHFMDTHSPYMPPNEYLEELGIDFRINKLNWARTLSHVRKNEVKGEEFKRIKKLYRGEARYVDTQVQNLIDFLKRKGLFEESLLIFTSDHGEEMMEHGVRGHQQLHNQTVEVPLIIKEPEEGGFGSYPRDIVSEQVDLLPTLLGHYGLEEANTDGVPLWEKTPGSPAFAEKVDTEGKFEVAIMYEDWKLIRGKGDKKLYDKDEERDSSGDNPSKVVELENLVEEHLSGTRVRVVRSDKDLESNVKSRLEHLGYM